MMNHARTAIGGIEKWSSACRGKGKMQKEIVNDEQICGPDDTI